MIKTIIGFVCVWVSVTVSASALAAGNSLPCLDSRGNPLQVDNEQVLIWKRSTPNQALFRAHVQGPVIALYPNRNGHNHFKIQIGPKRTDTLEVVYSQDFGGLPAIRPGTIAEACGDYITSDEPTAQYPASPDGAIIHWIHLNPSHRGHPSGFLILNGTVFGQRGGNGNQRN